MKTNIHEKIINQIKDLIESNNLKGGDRLPPERKLAELLGVSRNTVREAIKSLSEKGALASRKGSGTFVTEAGKGILEAMMADALEQKRHRLKEIIELREIIEPQIAVLAAKRINRNAVKILSELVSQQEKAFESGQSITELDVRFHRLVARSSGNSVLFSVYQKLDDIMSETRTENLQNPERNQQAIIFHKEILRCLKSGDEKGVEQIMKKHMQQVKQNII